MKIDARRNKILTYTQNTFMIFHERKTRLIRKNVPRTAHLLLYRSNEWIFFLDLIFLFSIHPYATTIPISTYTFNTFYIYRIPIGMIIRLV